MRLWAPVFRDIYKEGIREWARARLSGMMLRNGRECEVINLVTAIGEPRSR